MEEKSDKKQNEIEGMKNDTAVGAGSAAAILGGGKISKTKEKRKIEQQKPLIRLGFFTSLHIDNKALNAFLEAILSFLSQSSILGMLISPSHQRT